MKRKPDESFKAYRIRRFKSKLIAEVLSRGSYLNKTSGPPTYVYAPTVQKKLKSFLAKESLR